MQESGGRAVLTMVEQGYDPTEPKNGAKNRGVTPWVL